MLPPATYLCFSCTLLTLTLVISSRSEELYAPSNPNTSVTPIASTLSAQHDYHRDTVDRPKLSSSSLTSTAPTTPFRSLPTTEHSVSEKTSTISHHASSEVCALERHDFKRKCIKIGSARYSRRRCIFYLSCTGFESARVQERQHQLLPVVAHDGADLALGDQSTV